MVKIRIFLSIIFLMKYFERTSVQKNTYKFGFLFAYSYFCSKTEKYEI